MGESQDDQPARETDEWKRDLTVNLALEFASRLNDQGFVDACNQEMSGREERFMERFPNAAFLVVCHTILTDFCVERTPPKDASVLCSTIDRLLALELEYGSFPQFQEALDRVCVQLFLVLFRQHPGQYDTIVERVQSLLMHERKSDTVLSSLRTPLQFVQQADDTQEAFAALQQRCPYNSAVQFVHNWLKTTVMKLHEPCRLERLYDALVGDLSIREDTDLGSFTPIRDMKPPSAAESLEREPLQETSLPNMKLTLAAIRGAFGGSDTQFRAIWKQMHPKVLRFLKENRVPV